MGHIYLQSVKSVVCGCDAGAGCGGVGGCVGAGDRQLQMTTAGVPPSVCLIWRRVDVIGG